MGAAIAVATKRRLMMVVNCILIDLIWFSFYSSKERDVCVCKRTSWYMMN